MLAKSVKKADNSDGKRFTDAEGPLRNFNQTFADMLYKHFFTLTDVHHGGNSAPVTLAQARKERHALTLKK